MLMFMLLMIVVPRVYLSAPSTYISNKRASIKKITFSLFTSVPVRVRIQMYNV